MINTIKELLKNVTGGPVSTFIGTVLFLGGSYMSWTSWKSGSDLTAMSIEIIVLGVGVGLGVANDKWIRSLFEKK